MLFAPRAKPAERDGGICRIRSDELVIRPYSGLVVNQSAGQRDLRSYSVPTYLHPCFEDMPYASLTGRPGVATQMGARTHALRTNGVAGPRYIA
jgi:hypothetical protein